MYFPLPVGGTAYSNAHFGAGTGPIFLDDVQCISSASQLLECSSRPIMSHDCRHTTDAGVGCEGILPYYIPKGRAYTYKDIDVLVILYQRFETIMKSPQLALQYCKQTLLLKINSLYI